VFCVQTYSLTVNICDKSGFFWRWWHLLCLLNKFLWTKTSCFPFSLIRHRHSLVYRVDLGLTWLAPQDYYKTFFLLLCTASRWGCSFGFKLFRANHWSQIPFVNSLFSPLLPFLKLIYISGNPLFLFSRRSFDHFSTKMRKNRLLTCFQPLRIQMQI